MTEEFKKQIETEARQAVTELLAQAKLKKGDVFVVGCSSSEIVGGHIGKDSSLEAAQAVYAGVAPVLAENGIWLAAQCCEHLNRAIIIEREAAEKYGWEARIAEILSTTADFLLGLYRPVSNVTTPEERFFGNYAESLIPVIGTVKAGYGALAFEEDYGQEYARVKDPSNYFYLVVRGDSMEPRIQDGDLALVHKQDTLENGDLGVLVYGDEGEGTLKRYIQRGNCVVLQPFNPAYNELVIKGEDLNRLHIAGRVVETKAKW